MLDFEDYYEILGVNPEAASGEVKKAYRDQCFTLHPDRLSGVPDSVKKRAEQELVKVNRAYDVLRHSHKRREYHSEWLRRKAKPKPVIKPSHILFRDVEPGQIVTDSFVIENVGGRYTKMWVSNPQSWVRVVDYHYVTTDTELLRGVQLEAQGRDWGQTYRESIVVKLDEEETQVTVELQTRSFPKMEPRKRQRPKIKVPPRPRLEPQLKLRLESSRIRVAPLIFGFIVMIVLFIIGINVENGIQDKIVFQSNYGGNPEIYIINADGSNLKCLTNDPASDRYPVWAPDGSKIAFQSDRDGNLEVYVMNSDGHDLRRLTAHHASDWHPVWSPDSNKIAFQSDRDGNPEIYIRDIDRSILRRLTVHSASDWYPVWSPDGSKILFQSDRDGNSEIYIVNADGSNLKRLTSNPASDCYPSWSPKGNKIFFQSDRDGNLEIYVMNPDGSNLKRLIYSPRADRKTGGASTITASTRDRDDMAVTYALSPDGSKIAFQSDRDGNDEIYVMNANGDNSIRLTVNPASDKYPRWSPDSTKIVFQSDRDGSPGIYVMNTDGSSLKRLTQSLALDGFPIWSPKTFRLSFDNINIGSNLAKIIAINGFK